MEGLSAIAQKLYDNDLYPTVKLRTESIEQPKKTTMQPLRHLISPKTFVISLTQIAKHLKINPERILNWKKWHNVLWVHIEEVGGYFISYRKLEQWIVACSVLLRYCSNLSTLNTIWQSILQEAQRYTEDGLFRLETIWQQRRTDLSNRQHCIAR